MDRGAARSRKRLTKSTQSSEGAGNRSIAAAVNPNLKRLTDNGRPARSSGHVGGGFREGTEGQGQGQGQRPGRKSRLEKKVKSQLDEAVRYKPKAIRSSAALVWSETPFEAPPPKERLQGVRRVDLSGSGIKDVSWLEGMDVTWLSVANCNIETGWEAVGSLQNLSVLNISGCGLKAIPPSLAALGNLKALVAMNNEWSTLDEDVIASWQSLNSLIVSHSANLRSLPKSLSTLTHLSKLTFSHCALLNASSLPDLSSLPLLRDVKMNNLPSLTSLPRHLSSWGTGELSTVKRSEANEASSSKSAQRKGDGLEVLDLGNCSLPFSAIDGLFVSSSSRPLQGSAKWHLRSLSLHSNPLGTTHADYVERLQASPLLPNLQIIDAKRVVERKRKGEINESKAERRARERREKKMGPSGANVGSNEGMRKWGTDDKADKEDEDGASDGDEADEINDNTSTKMTKKERRHQTATQAINDTKASKESKKRKRDRHVDAVDVDEALVPVDTEAGGKRDKSDREPKRSKSGKQPKPRDAADSSSSSSAIHAPPPAPAPKRFDPTAQPSAVVSVIEVKKPGLPTTGDLTPKEKRALEKKEAKKAKKLAERVEAAPARAQKLIEASERRKAEEERRKVQEQERKEKELAAVLGGKSGKSLGGEVEGAGEAVEEGGLGFSAW